MDDSLKVLLIEDDFDQAALMKDCLHRFNPDFEIDTAASGEACLKKLAENHYGAIILDYSLPECDGLQVLENITSHGTDSPVIMVSASGNEKIAVDALKHGAEDYIVKDSDYLKMLPNVVLRSIEKNHLQTRLRESERKNQELFEKILNSKQRLQKLFDGIEDIIFEVSKNFEIVLANKHFAELCNSEPEKLIGKKYFDVDVNSYSRDDCPVKETFSTLQPQSVERTAAGQVYDIRTYPIFTKDGKLESVAVYIRNITEKKKFQKTLIQSEKLATIGLLASGIAHELRNPLNVIETARYYIDEFLHEKNEDIAAKLEIISKNVKRSSKIINNLLEFSRQSENERESIDLNKLIGNTIALIKKELDAKNIEYIYQGDPEAIAHFNVDSLKQALLNVLINGIQAMPKGGQLIIRVKRASSGLITIGISDTGTGIAEDDLPHIFSPFFTTKEAGVGTGLGLYISHIIIEREGGKISVDSKESEGTTFTISLPVFDENV